MDDADIGTIVAAAAPRSAEVLHFVDPSKEVNGGIWTLFVAASAFLGLRLWCKVSRRAGIWWDDYMLIASWLILLITCIVISVELATGYVTKTWDDRMLILVSVSAVLTTVGQAWSKTAFAITLLRPGITEGWKRWVLWFIIASLNIFCGITMFLQFTNYCGETPYSWKIQGGCANYDTIFAIKMGRNMYNIIMDFVLALFPWLVTWKLRIKQIEKIGICVTMSLGVVVAIVSTWRTAYMMRSDLNDYNNLYFWRQGMSEIWYQSEVAGTIIVQTLPVIRHLFRHDSDKRMLVSVNLNEIDTTTTSKAWTGIDSKASGRGREDPLDTMLKDLESNMGGGQEESYQRSLRLGMSPRRTSWSTFSARNDDSK